MTEHPEHLLSDEEIRTRMMSDPEVQRRIKEAQGMSEGSEWRPQRVKDAEQRWVAHYEDCETCMEGAEADEFNEGVEEFCTVGMRFRGDLSFEETRAHDELWFARQTDPSAR